jgi:uncharacterized protein
MDTTQLLTRTSSQTASIAALVAEAARAVPPLWPLESAIAVNPLAGFEDRPFAAAVEDAATLFGARRTLPFAQWQALMARGAIDERALRDAAIARLGGLDAAFTLVGVDVSRIDLLMARLTATLAPADAARAEAVAARFAAFATPPARPHVIAPTERIGVEMLGYARAFIAKWCGAFFDQSVAAMPMPNRERGLYPAVLALVAKDPDFIRFGGEEAQTIIDSAETDPLAAIEASLIALGLEGENRMALLRTLIARLPGWAGHIRWRTEHADPDIWAGAPAGMADYLALWLLVERACALRNWPTAAEPAAADPAIDIIAQLMAHFAVAPALIQGLPLPAARDIYALARMGEGDLGLIWLEAAERSFRDTLVPQLERAALSLPDAREVRPDAQLVFCIDVRSEPFRRAVEAQGAYETYGYAGFFGLPVALKPRCGHRRKQLPVLLKPAYELALEPDGDAGKAAVADQARLGATRDLLTMLKAGVATTFSTAEAVGPFAALIATARTLMPRVVRKLTAPDRAAFAPQLDGDALTSGLPLSARIDAARGFFAATGMPRRTARVVLLAGHGGEAVNNPYAAALDCGACGGHAGGPNARAMAAVLNDPQVRAALASDGEAIPDDTFFVAGEHNTTTDEVILFDLGRAPASHQDALARFAADLAEAGAINRARRAATLGTSADGLFDAAAHWAEVRPEWGLARNAAFIVAPRALSRQVDLGGRAFLHSYDWRIDGEDAALTLILTAPMVVAQWINCQYLFSTLDNDHYGAGDKTTHNVMGGIGVVQGNGGDLRVGLPRQSLFDDGGTPYHVPQRLLTIVYAPVDKVERVIAANPILQTLFGNGWVNLVVIDPATGKAQRRRPDGELADAEARTPETAA